LGRLTVPAIFTMVLAVMTALVLVGAAIVAVLISRTAEVTDDLSLRIQPARAEALRLQNALVDQENGARGYSITADEQFLEPYTRGLETEEQAAARMVELVGHHEELLTDLDEIRAAAATWRTEYAEPLVAGVTPGAPRPADARAAERGKQVFDRVRVLFQEENAAFDEAVAQGRADLDRIRTIRSWTLGGVAVAFLVAAAALAVLVRRLVTRPMDRLRRTSDRVAGGEFDATIDLQGPPDVRAVAVAVDAMRRRIVQELDASLRQQEDLRRQKAALDAQALELRRSNSELEQFAYVASHDLQEPLRKVASFCQLLEKRYGEELDDRGKQYIGFAVDGAKRMQVLINDLLTFSRVGRLSAADQSVALDAGLDEALTNLAAALEESGAVVERPNTLPHVTGDPTLLGMLWQNLVGNAIKFHRPGEAPRITVTCERGADADGTDVWQVAVADNGIGVGEEFAEKVFVIFQRLHSREAYAGTGIGLALCRKIVEHHGGHIWIDTTYTDGTRFCFTLPVAPETVPAADPRPATREGDRA